MQIIFHNIQSLRAHIDQIISDTTFQQSDVLLFFHVLTLLGIRPSAVGTCCYLSTKLNSNKHCFVSNRLFKQRTGTVSGSLFTFSGCFFCALYPPPSLPLPLTAKVGLMIEALVYIPGREYSAAATGDDFNLRFDGNESVKRLKSVHGRSTEPTLCFLVVFF
ncbi:hypothetical protein BCV71DRAFT_235290 [Rhizopus microsporus]|uniref:Uncharacterized protein n=1 Tax=Rhizopus microsporus TaxID=58291 RepID=A0A1X0S1I1_RHIZD|nr:hypothetical protein BCV71DRAFT_235290 [Rhizopus microsporus]